MYFHRSPKPDSLKKTFDEDRRQFSITSLYAHKEHKRRYESFVAGKWRFVDEPSAAPKTDSYHKAFAADFSASVAVGMVHAGYTEFSYFMQRQLDFCREAVLNLGFVESNLEKSLELLNAHDGDNVILVTGCQDARMLRRRVEKLVEFAINLYKRGIPFRVVFSGRCPKDLKVQIPNESIRMDNLFRLILKEQNAELLAAIPILSLEAEEKSSDTKENVAEFFQSPAFENHQSSVNIVAISSTFHLIRLWKAISPFLSSREPTLLPQINQIILVGAEDESTIKDLKLGDKEFIKLMLFDLYDAFVE